MKMGVELIEHKRVETFSTWHVACLADVYRTFIELWNNARQ